VAATIDGSLHGIDNRSGKTLWSLNCFNSSLVKSNFLPWGSKKQSKSGEDPEQSNDDRDDEAMFEELYIPEPTNGGTLYLYAPGKPIEVISSQYMLFVCNMSSPFCNHQG
jgi:hypothetical protein